MCLNCKTEENSSPMTTDRLSGKFIVIYTLPEEREAGEKETDMSPTVGERAAQLLLPERI